jgi:ketosteroid isomerase-like protein
MTRADGSSRRVVVAFNEAINRRDLDALAELMTDDHRFVDSAGSVVAGKDEVLAAWEGFFESFPDYRNDWGEVTSSDAVVTATGRSVCSNEPALDGPAIWTARTSGGKVSEWRVHEDTPANRRRLGI